MTGARSSEPDAVRRNETGYEASEGAVSGLVGVTLTVAGAYSAANAVEGDVFVLLAALLGSSGLYHLIAGGVVRGRQLSRR